MHKPIILLFSALFASLATCNGQSLEPPQPPTFSLNWKQVEVNDALVELGRKSKMNIMVDATQFSPDAAPISSDSRGILGDHLEALSLNQRLTWLPYRQTLLLWVAPDPRQLAQRVQAGETIKLIPPESSPIEDVSHVNRDATSLAQNSSLSEEELLSQEIAAYMSEKHGWDERAPGSMKEVRVSDLPAGLRAKVGAAVQDSLLRPDSFSIWSAWFSDKFWNNTELKVMEETNGSPNGTKIPVLTIGGIIQTKTMRGGSMISLGAIRGLPKF